MAKPTYSIGGLDFETLTRVNAFLGPREGATTGGALTPPAPPTPPVVAAPAAPMTPPAPPAPPTPPIVAATAAPMTPPAPSAPPAPAAPAAPAAPPTPAAAGAPTLADCIAAMGAVVATPGGAAKISPLLAQYNSQQPGVVGPASNIAPEQYQNFINAVKALG